MNGANQFNGDRFKDIFKEFDAMRMHRQRHDSAHKKAHRSFFEDVDPFASFDDFGFNFGNTHSFSSHKSSSETFICHHFVLLELYSKLFCFRSTMHNDHNQARRKCHDTNCLLLISIFRRPPTSFLYIK